MELSGQPRSLSGRYVARVPVELPQVVQLYGLGMAIDKADVNGARQGKDRRPASRRQLGTLAMARNVEVPHADACPAFADWLRRVVQVGGRRVISHWCCARTYAVPYYRCPRGLDNLGLPHKVLGSVSVTHDGLVLKPGVDAVATSPSPRFKFENDVSPCGFNRSQFKAV